jgi:RNA polymerase sigma-70 factor (ECF subfamily)
LTDARRESSTGVALALLVVRAQSGDLAALDRLLRDRQRPLYRHICGIAPDADLALDILQEVLLLVSRRLPALRDPRWFRAWAYRIATREALRRSRNDRWRSALYEVEDRADETASASCEAPALTREELEQRLTALPAASETVLRMHYPDELSFVEIAEALEIPVGTVKSRTAYGLATLRRLSRARQPS